MATPPYVPAPRVSDRRPTDFPPTPPPRRLPPRPVERLEAPREPGFGAPGPDAGYGFLLGGAHRQHELIVAPGERREDARSAVASLGVRRAGRAGRAPVPGDIDFGSAVLGYDGRAPEAFARWRAVRLHGVHEDGQLAQWLADTVEQDLGVAGVPDRGAFDRWWAALAGGRNGDVGARPA
jgi:hypothetical protein